MAYIYGLILSDLYMSPFLFFTPPSGVCIYLIPVLWRRKLKYRKFKEFTTCKKKNNDGSLCSPIYVHCSSGITLKQSNNFAHRIYVQCEAKLGSHLFIWKIIQYIMNNNRIHCVLLATVNLFCPTLYVETNLYFKIIYHT